MPAAQPGSFQALYRSCMKEAAAQGRTLMQRLVRQGVRDLVRASGGAADPADRKLLADAARTLARHEGALCESYPQALLQEFAHAISGDARRSGMLSFDSLELMGDEQMKESVDLLRLQQIVVAQVEPELAQLNALVSTVQGLGSVQADRNPLRPDVYVRSLRAVTLQSPVPAAVRTRWMLTLGEALGPELAHVYQELCVLLRSQGVEPASPGAADPAAARPAAAGDASVLNVKELRRLVAGELPQEGAREAHPNPRAPDFGMTMPAAFEALQEMRQVDKVMRRMQERGTVDESPRAAAQALGREVVKLMVENIAADTRLLAPVQQAVRELEPALQRLVLADPRFFSDRKHPARRLLEQMTQRSLAWDAPGAPGFSGFIEPLQQAVQALVLTQAEGAEPFEFALQSLEEAWGGTQEADRARRERAVRALLQAEQRNLLAEKVSREMRARPDVAAAPREIASFIAGPWSQVIAQARLQDASGSADPGGFAAAVPDLVWSTQPRLAAANPARLHAAAGTLVERLHHGLAMIDYPVPATRRIVEHVAAMHRQAQLAAESPGRPLSAATTMTRDELEAMLGSDEDTAPGPWLGATEAQHSGFMQSHASLAPRASGQELAAAFTETRPRELTAALPDSALRAGAWVEMQMEDGWRRYRVAWTSPHATLFLFVDAAGRTHSMTRRLLEKMLHGGALRLISAQGVIDGALDAVAQAALRNSLGMKL